MPATLAALAAGTVILVHGAFGRKVASCVSARCLHAAQRTDIEASAVGFTINIKRAHTVWR